MTGAAAAPAVRVGVGVLVFRGTEVLVGRRRNSHGAGDWALPGGHLEFGESWEACAARELAEETGIVLAQQPVFAAVNNNVMSATAHYVTIFMRCDMPEGQEAQLLEPHKCDGWQWVQWPNVPQPVFQPLAALLAAGYAPFAA